MECKALWQLVKEDERVVALDIDKTIEEAKSAFNTLHDMLEGPDRIKKWRSDEWLDKRKYGDENIDEYKKGVPTNAA